MNVIKQIDALGHATKYRFAGFNKLVEQIDPAGYSVKYLYDVEEDLIGVVNEAGEKYTILVDKAGRVAKEVGFDGRKLLFRYDRAGRCNETVNAEGRITKLERDALGRVVKRLVPKAPTMFAPIPTPEVVEYRYDARGDLVFAKNDAAEVTLDRDAVGRVVRETMNGVSIASAYNQTGDRVRRVSSLGHVTDYDVDARGLLRGLVSGTDAAKLPPPPPGEPALPPKAPWPVRITRDPDGAERTRSLPGGVTVRWDRDRAGRPAVQRVAREDVALLGRGYQWRSEEQLAAIVDTEKGPTRYTHDARGFLVAATTPDGITQHRSPDAVGNLYKTPKHTDRLYGHGGRIRLDGETRFLHDNDGNLIQKIEPDGGTWRYTWDGAGQLSRVTRPDGMTVEFAYDALGRRVSKAVNGQTTSFVWDGNDLLHELRDDGPAVTWLFEPDTFALMAKVEGHGSAAERRWGIVADHLGTPIAMTEEAGKLAWRAQLDAFGVYSTDVAKADCPWRWPGQYQDAETGLYYNRFRYYDPGQGRYVSQDPIGLLAGPDLYAYVRCSFTRFDPFGLSPWEFKPERDVDWRGAGKSFREALDEAFRRTGVPRDLFKPKSWGISIFGKTFPTEWIAPGGASVNVDHPGIIPTKEGPPMPHVGYQTPGKRGLKGGAVRGHVLLDDVPVTRGSLSDKKAKKSCG
jgi:RHS repeat-associated protein